MTPVRTPGACRSQRRRGRRRPRRSRRMDPWTRAAGNGGWSPAPGDATAGSASGSAPGRRRPRRAPAAPEPGPAVPKTRQITRWLLTRPDHLRPEEQEQLGQIKERCPHIQALAGYISSFAEMMTGRTGSQDLETWLTAIEADDGQPDLRSLATGIRNDQQAVANGLTLPWSSGKVEGTVNKIKMIKRQMYGRAGFALLRKRVILHPA